MCCGASSRSSGPRTARSPRKVGQPTPAIGLRITDNYRDNVTAIIKELIDTSQKHEMEIDVLLIDGHDMLRKARERGFVFYPWKPKPFGR